MVHPFTKNLSKINLKRLTPFNGSIYPYIVMFASKKSICRAWGLGRQSGEHKAGLGLRGLFKKIGHPSLPARICLGCHNKRSGLRKDGGGRSGLILFEN
jgi:hypothetical protein